MYVDSYSSLLSPQTCTNSHNTGLTGNDLCMAHMLMLHCHENMYTWVSTVTLQLCFVWPSWTCLGIKNYMFNCNVQILLHWISIEYSRLVSYHMHEEGRVLDKQAGGQILGQHKICVYSTCVHVCVCVRRTCVTTCIVWMHMYACIICAMSEHGME